MTAGAGPHFKFWPKGVAREALGQRRLRHDQFAGHALGPEPEVWTFPVRHHCFSSARAMISFITSLAPP